ncbi:hypothetical protein J3459_010250 [Metarhizium acridum]|uniref:GATA transcription factor AreB n=1 Tax=Metarhizium acridum (strain CQMa 102) TaxID=655827 RepID=E9EB17_METAQ|nr:GATA transcription factor AreB [Metarhizium acridum CQMa 102]EFY86849.1 GATA transcription factor AreB [Metarhizium acridum CQMa 102]KAG8422576.1 hypothetical protein J3459_010250 [Metarhizium acridum]KAG8425181.1 hypothetical protein J3458_001910 [Metarhizium acridum]
MMATNTSPTQPTCQNCTTSTTPLWRRDEYGSVLCNACGLFLKLHGRPRPISLKTDVIKSRNRVKTMRPDLAAKKKAQQQQAQNFGLGADVSGAALSAQNAAAAAQAIRRTSQKSNGNEGSDSPISRTGTPSMYNQGLPSFMVDDPYQGGSFNGSSENGDRDAPQTHEQLIAHNSSLKTRVSELEVINELFRGRLSQLEQQEAAARHGQEVAGVEQTQLRTQLDASQETVTQLQAQLEDSHRRENNLKRRLDELELELKAVKDALGGDVERPNKKPRIGDDAPAAVPTPMAEEEQPEPQAEPQIEQPEYHREEQPEGPILVEETMAEASAVEEPAAEETINEAVEETNETIDEAAIEDAVPAASAS